MFEDLMERLITRLLERLSSMEKSKALPMVDNWTWLRIAAIGERAGTGRPLEEPYGSTRDFTSLNHLMFLPAQLARLPLESGEEVDVSVSVGPRAKRPLRLDTPVMVGALGYGVSVSRAVKRAAARAATEAGTAVNSGESGFLAEERELAKRYVVQYNKALFGNADAELAQADMVEIRVGQGAEPSTGYRVPSGQIGDDLRAHLHLKEGEDAVMPSRFASVREPGDFRSLVNRLREAGNGCPVAVKIAAGDLRADLKAAVEAGVDAVVVDGAQGGTAGSFEVTVNHFGLPTAFAIPLAHRILQELGARDRVSLVASAGLRDAGDFLKAIALGADAVYIGQAAVVAMTYHQWGKMPPGTSPVEMFRYGGGQAEEFDENQGANDLARFLRASSEELRIALRALGRRSLKELSAEDLAAVDRAAADAAGVREARLL